jgi:hypothetical protein
MQREDRELTSASRLRITQELPLAVGTSPFHVKGHVYTKMIDDFAQNVPGGVAAVLARADDPTLSRFAAQRFTAAGWYDALPMMPLSLAHARVLGIPYHVHLRDRGRYVAARDIPGVYRFLLRLATPDMVMRRMPRAAVQYFDFGPSDVVFVGKQRAFTNQAGVPETLVPLIAATTEGFVATALEMAGAHRVVVRCTATSKDGARDGIDTFTVTLEATWQ